MLIQISQFILGLSLLVVLHELGHFIPAVAFRTRVEKFYLFFNPWFSLFKTNIRGTEVGIGWLPLGGYVKIAGMVDESMDTEGLAEEPKPYEYRSKKPWQRLIIILGGVTVNSVAVDRTLTGGWAVVGYDDLNGDKKADIVFRRTRGASRPRQRGRRAMRPGRSWSTPPCRAASSPATASPSTPRSPMRAPCAGAMRCAWATSRRITARCSSTPRRAPSCGW